MRMHMYMCCAAEEYYSVTPHYVNTLTRILRTWHTMTNTTCPLVNSPITSSSRKI